MSLTPDGYIPRVVDSALEDALKVFGAVEVAGTKWCGKTWTSLAHANSVSYVDLDENVAKDSPSSMLDGDKPHVVDEWQIVPQIWDFVRHEVDKTRGLRGGWILTGSSSPRLRGGESGAQSAPKHSGEGRIGRIRMYPMSLFESGESSGEVSLQALFDGSFTQCKVDDEVEPIVDAAVRGGWPETIGDTPETAQKIARQYLELFFSEGVPNQNKSGDVARRLSASIARNLGQSATYKTLITDMYGAESNPESMIAEQTVADYIYTLKRLYFLEELKGWEPASRSKKRLTTRPKRYFADPSLAVAMLEMSATGLVSDWQTFGLVFENMCYRDLSVYAQNLKNAGAEPLRYYRDDSGLEVDFIVELTDGRWGAIECKTGESKIDEAVQHLKRLKKKVISQNPHAYTRQPEFMAVVSATSAYAREVEDGIFVIPLRALRP